MPPTYTRLISLLIYFNSSVLVLENGQYRIKEKPDFTTKIAHLARLAVRVVEVTGSEVEVEVGVGHDHTQDHQDLNQDQDPAQEARTEVGIEVEEVWICVMKDGHLGVEVDPSVPK